MADEAQATPAAAPSTTFDDNTMIPVQLADGKMGMEPLKNVRAAMAEASQLRSQVAQAQAWKQDHDTLNQIRGDFVEDPKRAAAKINRWFGIEPEAADDDMDPSDKRVKKLEAQIDTLTKVVQRAGTETQRERALRETDDALNTYPVFDPKSDNPVHKIARTRAREFIITAKAAGDQRPIREIAAEVHADIYAMAVGKATETAKAREAQDKANPVLPQGQGAPSVTTPPKMTVKEAFAGGIERLFSEAHTKGGMGALGFRNAVNNRRT
jgi:vacuolar-type H+-ATPase subunit I/STV1